MSAEQRSDRPEDKPGKEKEMLKVGRLLLAGEINEELFRNTMPTLLDQIEDPQIKKIVITLTTGGGLGEIALGFYDLIKNSPKLIEIVGVGRVMSAGLIILSAASRRYATENTHLMFHVGVRTYERTTFTPEELSIEAKEAHRHEDLVFRIVAERVGVKPEKLKKKFSPVGYINAQEARDANIIDEVISSPLELLEME